LRALYAPAEARPGSIAGVSEIRADIVAEAKRVLELADAQGVPLRVLGGVAIHLRAPQPPPPALTRTYGDVDFVTVKGSSGDVQSLLRGTGYEPHAAFNALHGTERLLFFDDGNERQVDVFVGGFSMSHEVPVAERLELEPDTLPLAELLVTKLQIAELNEKDVRDALALFYGHPVDERDGDAINAARVAEMCRTDWGLWRTLTGNLAACRDHLERYDLPEDDRARLRAEMDTLLDRIEREPKSRRWKLRARVGERKRWYTLPEEVAGGP
jgi:hypothetical protein